MTAAAPSFPFRRSVLVFLIALASVVVLGCDASPLAPEAGKVKLSGAPKTPQVRP
ncbi:MAG TPA: hypothetical protein VIC56_07005 [Gemmatimonadota bacterium]